MRLAQQAPSAAVNPLTVSDAGGLNMLAQTGEFLIFDNNQLLKLEPMLATELDAEHATARCGRSSCARTSSSTTARR